MYSHPPVIYPAEEIIGKRQEELFPPDIAKRHKQVVTKIFETGQQVSIGPSPHPLDRFPVKIRDSFSYVHLLFSLVSTLGIGSPRWSF